jgi:phosphatidylglycerol---prolipoprotein diacylglyceryl transferase
VDAFPWPLAAWLAAFWVAVLGFAARRERAAYPERFLAGLVLGAAFSHLGWAALHPILLREAPRLFLEPGAGYTVSCLPLGFFAAAPWRAPPAERSAWLAAALGSLPLAIAVARLGCLAAGCCHGLPSVMPWAMRGGPDGALRHPTPLYEIAGLAALHFALRILPRASLPAAALAGLGAVRLAVSPWRAEPRFGPPVVMAAAWVAIGLVWCATGAREAASAAFAPGRRSKAR